MDRYLIEVYGLSVTPKSIYIDGIVLEGEKSDLMEKMSNIDYVESIGIHPSFFFEKFKLVKESDVDFP